MKLLNRGRMMRRQVALPVALERLVATLWR